MNNRAATFLRTFMAAMLDRERERERGEKSGFRFKQRSGRLRVPGESEQGYKGICKMSNY